MNTGVGKGRIAVIDDDAVFIEMMRDLVDGEGYELVTVPHWLEGVELLRDTHPDLIILDLMLGRGLSGLSVLEVLRADPALSAVPVILCSAAAPVLSKCGSSSIGTDAPVETVAKPFDVDNLLEVV